MVQINFARREIQVKLVFYGPGMSGKTTNLEKIHALAPKDRVGELTSIATEQDRTLFFDFMPLDLGSIGGMKTKFLLYTVPGQVYYNQTRKLVLQGCDGILFVADSGPDRMADNEESIRNLGENLREMGRAITDIPVVIQYNKRDLPGALPVEELNAKLNRWGFPTTQAVAVRGEGVMASLKALAGLVIEKLNREYGGAPAPEAVTSTTASAKSPPSAAIPATTSVGVGESGGVREALQSAALPKPVPIPAAGSAQVSSAAGLAAGGAGVSPPVPSRPATPVSTGGGPAAKVEAAGKPQVAKKGCLGMFL